MSNDTATAHATAWRPPTPAAAWWRACKVAAHIARRGLLNAWAGPQRWPVTNALAEAPALVELRSALWEDGRDDEFLLRAGKVQNLRQAARAFHGIVVPAGETLSFWAQLGRMSSRRGFAVGREIISGCVVPTMGGGICQLSNALAQAAHATGIPLTEWHRHSALIDSAMPQAIDATVAWNYVDLRLRPSFAVRVEVELTATELVLRLRADGAPAPRQRPARVVPIARPASPTVVRTDLAVARGCLTCDETSCFRHQPAGRHVQARRAVLVGAYMPELADWLADPAAQSNAPAHTDWLLGWERPARRRWSAPLGQAVDWLYAPTLQRMWRSAWQRGATQVGEGGARQRGLQRHADELAAAMARRLRPEHVALVLTQDLLVPLWRSGALAGRQFDVWVDALPANDIQRRLDAAAQLDPNAASLNDFRVDAAWLRDENLALAAARRRLTAHAEVARVLRARGWSVDARAWRTPASARDDSTSAARLPRSSGQPTLVLPASALPRKGAPAVAEVARGLGARVLILGTPPTTGAVAWAGVDWQALRYADDWLHLADVVLLPAVIEHRPRALLQALAHGVPVVATPACGLPRQPGLRLVEPGDLEGLLAATRAALTQRQGE